MIRMGKTAVLAAVAVAGLAGCASEQACDPTQTGFLSGIGCAVGGGYQNRQNTLNDARIDAQQNAAQQRADAAVAQRQQQIAQQTLAQRRARAAQQDRELATLRSRLQQAQARGASGSQLQEAQSALAETQRLQGSSARSDADLAARSAAQERLRRSLDALAGL